MAKTDATPSTSDRIGRLAFLSADERRILHTDLVAEFKAADDAADIKAMQDADQRLELLTQFEDLVEQMSEVEQTEEPEKKSEPEKKAEPEPEPEPKKDDSEQDEDEDEEADEKPVAEDEKKAEKPAAKTPASGEKIADATDAPESEVVAMAASAIQSPEELKPVTPTALTASAHAGPGLRDYASGQQFKSMEDIAEATAKQLRAIGTSTGEGTKALVASFQGNIPEDRFLEDSDAIKNQGKIDAVVSIPALVASGGFCAPLPVNYDIFGVGSTARPIRDSLPSFGATRGGIRFIAPPTLGGYTNAISLWTAANDANPTSPTTKPRLKVNCANELTATTDAITLSLEFGNLMTRAFPELVQRHNQLALVQHARFAERTLLSKISALSNKVTTPHVYGTGRDILINLSEAIAAYRNRHRIPRPVRLRGIFPEWVRDAVREDIATNFNQGVQDIAIGDAAVDAWFSSRGVTPTWHMDETFPAQTLPGELNGFPATIKYWLFAEGTLLFLDGGTLDLGVVRDADLVATNDYITFVEAFEGVAKVGIEVLEVTATTQIGLPPEEVTP